MSKSKSQKAFTLIELLVVMAIIAILSAIMFGPIQTARRRSKDTQAVADMKLIANNLELYYQDKGYYPGTPSNAKSYLSDYGNVPTRFNNTTSVVYDKYNYVAEIDLSSGSTIGFHLWTHLNDMNEAFNSDADCNSNTSPSSCWPTSGIGNGPKSVATTSENGLNATVCSDKTYCILDYANGK